MRKLYLAQINNSFGGQAFLPYSVGMLWSYAQSQSDIAHSYQLGGFLFLREPLTAAAARLDQPGVLALSCYLWNWNYNMELARLVRNQHPQCVIILGGPEVPSSGFTPELAQLADYLVHDEGEITFVALLRAIRDGSDPSSIAGISYVRDGAAHKTEPRTRLTDLSVIPSPYITGVFDTVIAEHPSIRWHASQETHRGCPYSCTFCDWGSAVYTKIRQFDQPRLIDELDWFGTNQIDLLYNCDANYGIYARDIELTTAMVATKQRLGYPQKFRASYAKKSDHKVFEISRMLNDAGMSKGVTLSMQSMDPHTLETIKRKNIAIEDFRPLVEQYREHGIPTYTELIIGLPGETLASYKAGIETLLQGGQHDNLVIYTCMVLRNSEMADAAHMAAQGIVKQRVPLMDNHSSTRPDEIAEYNDIVIATHSMPHADWRSAYMISWIVQALHCLGLTQYLAMDYWRVNHSYVEFYERLLRAHQDQPTLLGAQIARVNRTLDRMLGGAEDLGQSDHRFGDINWPVEELTFLQLRANAAQFYEELRPFLAQWMTNDHITDAIHWQQQWILGPDHHSNDQHCYSHDIPHMIAAALRGQTGPVLRQPVTVGFTAAQYHTSTESWARHIVWYGRKQVLHKRSTHVVD
jgi:hypothetical protein